jgi:Cu/Ag efflux pump CusA
LLNEYRLPAASSTTTIPDTGIGLPLSFFISMWIFYMFGISLNIVVLFGLVLSTGMIVDATSVAGRNEPSKITTVVERSSETNPEPNICTAVPPVTRPNEGSMRIKVGST